MNSSPFSNSSSLESIKVAIRIRPLLHHEIEDEDNMIYTDPADNRKIKLIKNENCFEGFFDRIFPFHSTQEDIFQFVKESLNDVVEGINCTIFTYGQTGSGKTYTMFGSDWTVSESSNSNNNNSMIYPNLINNNVNVKDGFIVNNDFVINPFSNDNGIVPRSLTSLFLNLDTLSKSNESGNTKHTVYCSFLQIYNEKIYDLLEDNSNSQANALPKNFNTYINTYKTNQLDQKSLNLREDKINGIYVDGLSEYIVENVYECLSLLKKGEKNRKKRQTKKNEMSSRSHTVFTLIIEGDKVNKNGTLKRAKFHLCDLAGSEKVDKDSNPKSSHFNEMVNINLSLGTLGKVIHALATKQNHVPYRDSKITRLLQDSLGGNTRTYVIANVSPNILNYDETVSTLKFADRAKSVLTKIKPNEIVAYDENLVNKLTKEINELKAILALRKKRGTFNEIQDQFIKLKEENEKLKKYVISNMTSENIEKLMKENKVLKIELQKIKSSSNEVFEENNLLFSKHNINNIYNSVDTHTPIAASVDFKSSMDYRGPTTDNKLVKAGFDIMNVNSSVSNMNDGNTLNTLNNINNLNNVLNTNKHSNYKAASGMLHEVKELKVANERLKFLEQMEKKSGLKMKNEIERIHNEKMKRLEEKFNKHVERKKNIEKMEGHLKRIDYLYKNNNNVYSNYLIETTNKGNYNSYSNTNSNASSNLTSNSNLNSNINSNFNLYIKNAEFTRKNLANSNVKNKSK